MKFKGGVHSYFGKRNSRAKRFQSKLMKGVKKIDTTEYFKQIEDEHKTPQQNRTHKISTFQSRRS